MIQLKSQTGYMKKSLVEAKANVKQLLEARKANGIADRKKLHEASGNVRSLLSNFKQTVEKLKNDIATAKDNNKSEIEMLNHDLESNEIKHALDLQQAENKKKETIDSFNLEYEEAQQRLKNTFDSYGDSVKDLMEKHKIELEKISAAHEKFVQESEVKLSQKHKEILAKQEDQAREYKSAVGQLEQAKSNHERDIKSLGQTQSNEINIENQKFNKMSKEIQDDIDKCLQGGNDEIKKFKDILQNLRNEKEKIINEYSQKVTDFDSENTKIANDLQSSNLEEIEKFKNEKTKAFDELVATYDREYAQLKQKLDSEYEELQKTLENEFNKKIEGVNENRKEKSEIDSLISNRQAEYDKEVSNLERIQAPEIENNPMFKKYDDDILELDQKRKEAEKSITDQKKALEEDWKSKFDQENDRHALCVVRTSVGTKREQMRLGLLQEIGDVKQQIQDEKQKLNDIINQLTNEHNQLMDKLRSDLISSQNTDEIDKLKKELESLSINSDDLKSRSISMFEKRCKDLQFGILEENKLHDNNVAAINRKISDIEKKFISLFKEIEKNMKESEINFEKECKNFKEGKENKIKDITQAHINETNRMMLQYENLKEDFGKSIANFQKRLKDNNSQYQSTIDEFTRTSKEDLERRKNDWAEMQKFYEEKINVLTNKRDEAIQQFEKRPPRQSEIDIIEKLQMNLQTRTIQLKNAIKELTEYRTMLVKQEKEYNSRFGKGPKVGILSTAKH